MTTLIPRKPYTDEELTKLYPPNLELQLVQVLMRHGERTPVNARFENTGLPAYWPYCSSVRKLISPILTPSDDPSNPKLSTIEWTRRLETFSNKSDAPILATSPSFPHSPDNICEMGTLTDLGRTTTYNLGTRLRNLYINRLAFLPPAITPTTPTSTHFYLRTTPVPRALESLQQTFSALYPPHTRDPTVPPPTIITRIHADETLYPNDGNCRRFAELSRLFAQRAANKWNNTKEMDYLNSLYGKYMPDPTARVGVDSRPRLSGIMDTINATLAHGPETKLPDAFYDEKGREIIEKIGVEEWFAGYSESREYRMLGIGGLLGDLVGRMVGSVEKKEGIKFGLHGCHDTTLAGVLMGLGAYGTERWPPFTSHIAVEMFREAEKVEKNKGWWDSLVGSGAGGGEIGRRSTEELSENEKKKFEGYYVRLRYNDEPVMIPGCKKPGNHLQGDESFCTLAAFKEIVDKFTPENWKQQCRINKGQPHTPNGEPEWAGN
ncbi:histidine phosphatase superfamily [Podospora fimiseda]|uniref:3-phytase n=1 Tax=Podospora fimiseda TaxID=252190 RepID=A0AAN7H780_9PEZI|nr:histidine phosphatase superfamily [Podospora fimiseda]